MKHLFYLITAILAVYLLGSLLMFDFEWILHVGFLEWIVALFITLWLFGQIEKEYGGWNIEAMQKDLWNKDYKDPLVELN